MYIIYGVSDCPSCLRAQALCMDKNIDYAWVMMDWSKQYRKYIKNSWKWKTYPIITEMRFDEDSPEEFLVGGFDELAIVWLSNNRQHTYYVEDLSPGDLVKWIIDYRVFEADEEGGVFPVDAVWAKGIVIEVSTADPLNVVVIRMDTETHQILHMLHDGLSVISKANGG